MDDPPLAVMVGTLIDRSADVVVVDELALGQMEYDVSVSPALTGWINTAGRRIPLEIISGVFLRTVPARSAQLAAASSALALACSTLPAVVVNRPSAGRSNWSKPFQLRMIAAAGLAVADTLVTTDSAVADAFVRQHGRVVYKSVSGVRSIVAIIDAAQADYATRLKRVANGPVQLQRWIDGDDVRVHVVADRWFATAITSTMADYRYAALHDEQVSMSPTEIPVELGRRLVDLTVRMGLVVSGIDLRVTPEGQWYCFEVNPAPGFTYYEDHTGQPIAAAIADVLLR